MLRVGSSSLSLSSLRSLSLSLLPSLSPSPSPSLPPPPSLSPLSSCSSSSLSFSSSLSLRRHTTYSHNDSHQRSRFTPYVVMAGGALSLSLSLSLLSAERVDAEEEGRVDWGRVRKEIVELLETKDDDGSNGPLFVRLAWHAAGTYDRHSKTGGSNGATMRFSPESSDGANAGLDKARNLLEKVKKNHPSASYADLWTLAGCVAIEEMGGPKIDWRSGRIDYTHPTPQGERGGERGGVIPPNGRLPDALQGAQHIRDVFYRMGFSDREIVALLGAHCLGRCHADRSGFVGPWTHSPTTFSNEYFRELLESKWTVKKWNGPLQYEDGSKELMMLVADLALVQDPEFVKYVRMYKDDEELFFRDFAAAWKKLIELGVPAFH